MGKNEEELLIEEKNREVGQPAFQAPDGKILALGDMFRGPSTGFISEIDLDLDKKQEERDQRFD